MLWTSTPGEQEVHHPHPVAGCWHIPILLFILFSTAQNSVNKFAAWRNLSKWVSFLKMEQRASRLPSRGAAKETWEWSCWTKIRDVSLSRIYPPVSTSFFSSLPFLNSKCMIKTSVAITVLIWYSTVDPIEAIFNQFRIKCSTRPLLTRRSGVNLTKSIGRIGTQSWKNKFLGPGPCSHYTLSRLLVSPSQ